MANMNSRREIVEALQEARRSLKEARDAGESKTVQGSLLAACETYQFMLDSWDKNFGKDN